MLGIGATIGKIFGSDKALTSIVDNVSKGLDALVYTDEEKAQDAQLPNHADFSILFFGSLYGRYR